MSFSHRLCRSFARKGGASRIPCVMGSKGHDENVKHRRRPVLRWVATGGLAHEVTT